MIRGISVENLEKFENNKEAILKFEIQLLLVNYRKLRFEKSENTLIFYKKGKSFGSVTDNKPIYELNIDKVDDEQLEIINLVFNDSIVETLYDVKLTHKLGDYAFTIKPDFIFKDRKDQKPSFILPENDIIYGKIIRIHGTDEIYPLVDMEVILMNEVLTCKDIPSVMLFSNAADAVDVCRLTPEKGYTDLDEYIKTCETYIKYKYKIDFGFAYKSETYIECIPGYKSEKMIYTYKIIYDTDYERALTHTIPVAVNEITNKVYNGLTACRADSIGKDGINISVNGEEVKIKSLNVKSAFHIEDLDA